MSVFFLIMPAKTPSDSDYPLFLEMRIGNFGNFYPVASSLLPLAVAFAQVKDSAFVLNNAPQVPMCSPLW
jgi:hypothetical protein